MTAMMATAHRPLLKMTLAADALAADMAAKAAAAVVADFPAHVGAHPAVDHRCQRRLSDPAKGS